MIECGNVLTDADLEALKRSWIDRASAERALLRRVASIEGAELVGQKDGHDYAGIVFPNVWPGESHPREFRLRRDSPDVTYEKGEKKYLRRYLGPPGRGNLTYFVPGTSAELLDDPNLPIVITEGEKKCISLWRLAWHGISDASERPRFLPVALPGVWGWRGSVGKESGPHGERINVKGVIPDFDRIAWTDRKAIIAFDSDVKTNDKVRAARLELARHLIHERGAQVHYLEIYLISMIDDATSRLFARFVRHDTSEENRLLLRLYLERYGRPLAFYTDKAGMFQVAVRSKRQEQREGLDRQQMPPTQIARALGELGIVWIPAHSAQAKGRVERQFLTAQDRLVKGLRLVGARTLEEANAYLENEYLLWWNKTLIVTPANPTDAHRALGQEHDLAAILSPVESRQVTNDYTIRWDAKFYQIDRRDVRPGMRKAWVRVEQRLDGTIAARFQNQYVRVRRCAPPLPAVVRTPTAEASPPPPTSKPKGKSPWMKNFSLRSGRRAIEVSHARS